MSFRCRGMSNSQSSTVEMIPPAAPALRADLWTAPGCPFGPVIGLASAAQ